MLSTADSIVVMCYLLLIQLLSEKLQNVKFRPAADVSSLNSATFFKKEKLSILKFKFPTVQFEMVNALHDCYSFSEHKSKIYSNFLKITEDISRSTIPILGLLVRI